MNVDKTIQLLSLINYALGIAIGGISIVEYVKRQNTTPLIIMLAVIVAGPLEDLLTHAIEKSGQISPIEKKKRIQIVDQLTSIGFLLFLLLAAIDSCKN
jgi:hypothetical protein